MPLTLYSPRKLTINPGPMRRGEPRRPVHQLYSFLDRVQDTHAEAKEDGNEEGV